MNRDKYIEFLDSVVQDLRNEQSNAVQNGWFDKAAKIEHQIDGLTKARFYATSGDFNE